MIYANSTFGSPIALQLHDSSPTLAASTCSLHTVADLLEAIAEGKPDEPIPQVSPTVPRYCWSIQVDDMPEPLRSEVRALLRWKLDRLVEDRPPKMKIRPAMPPWN